LAPSNVIVAAPTATAVLSTFIDALRSRTLQCSGRATVRAECGDLVFLEERSHTALTQFED
jgi:hypothetical protein